MAMEILKESLEKFFSLSNDSSKVTCDIIPQLVGWVPNPLYLACKAGIVIVLKIFYVIYVSFHVASMALDHALYAVTVGGATDLGTHLTCVAMFENFKGASV